MAGVCVGDGREGETMGVDEGRDGGGAPLFSALQLLFCWIITLHPHLTPNNQGNVSGLETGATSRVNVASLREIRACQMIHCEVLMVSTVSHFS